MITETIKETLEKYIRLCSWFLIKDGDKDVASNQFETVLKEIGNLEDKLIGEGVSGKTIETIVEMTRKNTLEKPISELSDSQLLKVCKLIFGKEVEFEGGATP